MNVTDRKDRFPVARSDLRKTYTLAIASSQLREIDARNQVSINHWKFL